MDEHTLRQLRGAKDLAHDAVDAAVTAVEKAQRGVVHRTYSIVAAVSHLGRPVHAVESVQQTIARGIYGSVRLGNHATTAAASLALDCLESRAQNEEMTEVSATGGE